MEQLHDWIHSDPSGGPTHTTSAALVDTSGDAAEVARSNGSALLQEVQRLRRRVMQLELHAIHSDLVRCITRLCAEQSVVMNRANGYQVCTLDEGDKDT